MRITYYGHACFGLETKGKHLLFDPFITPNDAASHVDVNSVPADFVLISHGHEDHLADAESIARRTAAPVISNFEVATWYHKKGLDYMPMNHGGQYALDACNVKYVNAIHSSVLPDGTNGGNPGGFVVHNSEGCLYYAGDTALNMDMQLLKMEFNIDIALLPIGDVFTMGVADAIKACDFIGCNRVIGLHYDTFPPIAIDKTAAKMAFKEAGKELILLDIGSTWEL